MLKVDELFCGAAALGQVLLEAVEDGHYHRVLIAQALYALAVGLSFAVHSTVAGIAAIFLIQLNYVLAPPIPILSRF